MNQTANNYQASTAAYKDCLAQHAPKDCEGLRLAMEADEHEYQNRVSAITNHQGTINVNTQSR
jgi:hypothetical protein